MYKKTVHILWRMMLQHKRDVLKMAVAAFVNSVHNLFLTLIVARFMGMAIQEVSGGNGLRYGILSDMIWVLAFALLFGSIAHYMKASAEAGLAMSIKHGAMGKFLDNTVEADYHHSCADKISCIISDIPFAVQAVSSVIEEVSRILWMGVGGLVVIICFSRRAGIVTALLMAGNIVYSLFFARRMITVSHQIQEKKTELIEKIKNIVEGIIVVKLFDTERRFLCKFEKTVDETRTLNVKKADISAWLGGMNNFAAGIGTIILYLVMAHYYMQGDFDMAVTLQLASLGSTAIYATMFARGLVGISEASAGLERYYEVVDAARAEHDNDEVYMDAEVNSCIAFEEVSFKYQSSRKKQLENVSFQAEKGEITALKGASGGGKTTILRLMAGLYKPISGQLTVLGHDIRKWNSRALRRNLAFVPQDTILISDTLRQNIVIGCPEATEEDITVAAEKAGILSYIKSLPEGLETFVTENGSSLSGGQRQRIAIARALVRDAPVILLDEPTSAMDQKTEQAFLRMIQQIKANKIIIMSAHRKQALEAADKVVEI